MNTTAVTQATLVKAAHKHIHCLFMALPSNLKHKDMMTIALRMDDLESSDNLEQLFKFADQLKTFDLDQAVIAYEMVQCTF